MVSNIRWWIAFLASMGIGAMMRRSFRNSVGAKTLKLWHAILIAAVFEFSGAFLMEVM